MAKSVVRWSIGGVVVLALGLLAAGAAAKGIGSGFVTCADELGNPPEGEDFCLLPEKLPFDALEDFPAQRDWGVLGGAGFRVEIPENWNGDLVMYAHGFRGAELQAIDLVGAKGNLDDSENMLWRHTRQTSYVPSALLSGRNLYFLKGNNGIISCFDAVTGRPHYSEQRLDLGVPHVPGSSEGQNAGLVLSAGRHSTDHAFES